MEPEKIILDMVITDMGQGLASIFQVQAQNPDQLVGKEHAVRVDVNGRPYDVVRNLNSYTIRPPYTEENVNASSNNDVT